MADTATGRVALFSIHPEYATAILNGTKQVEFRRQPLPLDVTHVVMYATSPRQQIVGIFEVDGVEAVSPREAWTRYRTVGGIDKASFDRYYDGTSLAYVIRVRTAHATAEPFALNEVDDCLRPPQSFQYLRGSQLERTRRLLAASDRRSRTSSRLMTLGPRFLFGAR